MTLPGQRRFGHVLFAFERIDVFLALFLVAFLARIWLMPLRSSLWVDELVTVFVLRYPGHASFADAPQVPQSIYYGLPGISWALFGDSEAALRLPSIVAMGIALFFIARIANRLIHPRAGWFAVFACLAFRNLDYFAVDARPYGLGIAVASASLLFLIRWFDRARWRDAAVFVLLAALLWRVHLFYWPFYLVYAAYAAVRLARRDTQVTARQIGIALLTLGAALLPVAFTAIAIARNAGSHAFLAVPTLRNLFYLVHAQIVLGCLAVALGAAWLKRAQRGRSDSAGICLIVCWWLICPLALFFYSRITGNGVLTMRYVSLMLPGLALTIAAVCARFVPGRLWKPLALAVGTVALAFLGQWRTLWPAHELDNWRDAAALERTEASSATPVICISPFIEAQPPVWTPEYRTPGFLYSSFLYYPVRGDLKLLPYEPAPESERYIERLLPGELLPAGKFIVYGSTYAVRILGKWLSARPELAGWHKDLNRFDMISVAVYRKRPEGLPSLTGLTPRDIP